jgi:hypothetical protein
MPVHVWTSDGHDFTLADNTSLDETVQRIRAAMDGQGSVVEFDLASGHILVLNGRTVGWATAFNIETAAVSAPSVVNYTTMILSGGESSPPTGPRPR